MSVDSIGLKKSKQFAIRIIGLYRFLQSKREFVMSKQILRSGTSVGANITEGIYAQSKADYVSKISIALKEAAETDYWLSILYETISEKQYQSMHHDCAELIYILSATVRKAKQNL